VKINRQITKIIIFDEIEYELSLDLIKIGDIAYNPMSGCIIEIGENDDITYVNATYYKATIIMKKINPTNASEKQVVEHLEMLTDAIVKPLSHVFGLKPQGMNTIIEKEAINLMTIRVTGYLYTFGGITEKFYDEVVDFFSVLES